MLKAFLWANTKQKSIKSKKMTKFFQNDKRNASMLFNDALFKSSP
ncbi:hypothetical protein [Helicobacter pylori]|nr:hypothetical protein [Helicobacter pylori]